MPKYQPRGAMPGNVSLMLRAYLECAEWAGLSEEESEALELSMSPAWDQSAIDAAGSTIEDFRSLLAEVDPEALQDVDSDAVRAGHDLFLTRNGHGAGFWDGDWQGGVTLTEAAKTFGECYVFFDEDTERLHIYD